jgi:DNA-binding HxlR family transcriptional regulator
MQSIPVSFLDASRSATLAPMLGKDYAGQNCSIARTLEIVGERWSLLILRDAFLGVTRYEHFQQRLAIAPNMLAKRLRTLTEAGLLERRRYRERPERFEYLLTDAGKEMLPVLLGLMRWGDAHLAPNGAPVVARHAGCGGELDGLGRCERCGEAVGADGVEWHTGPGSTRPPGPIPRPPRPAPVG